MYSIVASHVLKQVSVILLSTSSGRLCDKIEIRDFSVHLKMAVVWADGQCSLAIALMMEAPNTFGTSA
jgi:hypothetical protein